MDFFDDETSDGDFCEVTTILRLHLRRSVRSFVAAGSALNLELSYSAEFCDSVPSLLGKHVVMAVFIKGNNASASELFQASASLNAFEVLLEVTDSSSSCLSLTVPNEIGFHQLFLFNRKPYPNHGHALKPLILPLLTGCFSVVEKNQLALTRSAVPVLTNYRLFSGILIEEEYGKTLGSHIYDSSVSIIRYLSRKKYSHGLTLTLTPLTEPELFTTNQSRRNVALELGAGCGLVSIWLSKESSFHRVIATDMACQLPLIVRNITRNGTQDGCSARELDWSTFALQQRNHVSCSLATEDSGDPNPLMESSKSVNNDKSSESCCRVESIAASSRANFFSSSEALDSYQHQCASLGIAEDEVLALVVAGDVLYSRSLAQDFFAVVRAVAVPDVTVILVAQKLRNADQRDSLDVRSLAGLRSEIVWQEANVIIWKIYVLPCTD